MTSPAPHALRRHLNGESGTLPNAKINVTVEEFRWEKAHIKSTRLLGSVLARQISDEVFAADELLLSSATREVLAVTELDGQAVGTGHPGPIYERLYARYQQAKKETTE
jgi:branched-subunit amino acid aminotransferase/4-amino-4-deoxychorismate lyase